jgi:diguanylate cyclase (GGDEF)-like protein
MDIVHDSSKPPLVLMVDDDPAMRMHLRVRLEREGYLVAEAKDGREGLAICQEKHPDIILLDAMMPDVDGFEFCAQVQNFPRGQHIPILMITGLDDRTSVDRAFAAGAADYITKPVHWAVLRQRLRRLIQQSQLQMKLEAANRELQRIASMDGLTQVANRRRFDEYLQQEWQRMLREQLPLSLILCDIDFFKPYNDTYGHQAGDRCLQQVAQALQTAVRRPADLVARYGGEELAIILPNTQPEGAGYVAQQVCAIIKNLAIPHASSLVHSGITISAGAAGIIPPFDLSVEDLIASADRALYQAKAAGRDRYCLDPKGSLKTGFKPGKL